MENEEEKNVPQEQPLAETLVEYLHDLVYILVVVTLLGLVFFRVVRVDGSSMYNTLIDGDRVLLLSGILYNQPQQGDIVVACKESFDNGSPIIKRIIATEGQIVDIDFDAGIVYVDGVALEEDYTYTPTTRNEGVSFPLRVEPGHVFLMGDNRDRSKDSRSPEIGQVDRREILGKAVFIFMPGTDDGNDPFDLSRIGVLGK